jgi:diguanylate cyclase (GGDEF)-like protein
MVQSTLGGWLIHVMSNANGALSLEEALHVILDSMKEYFPSQSIAVILIDQDTNELRIKMSRQLSHTFVKKYHRNSPGPTIEQVILEQRPILLNNIDRQSVAYQNLKLEHDFKSAVIAPIIRDQHAEGFIFCDRNDDAPFTESDLLHLQVVGMLTGSLMEKFELIRAGKQLAQVDDATGVLQYKAFVPAFATELERATTHNYTIALALIATGAFRNYIQTYGIDEAHALLREVASIIKKYTRDVDLLARFGADEFVLCLTGVSADEAQQKLQTILRAVPEEAFGQGDSEIAITMGALILENEKQLNTPLQDILGALGKNLVTAKSSNQPLVISALQT